MSKLEIELKNILKIAAFSGLTASATVVSGYQEPLNKQLINNVQKAETVQQETRTEYVEQLYMDIESAGALYVYRKNNELLFWVIKGNTLGANVHLYDTLEIPAGQVPTQVNIIVNGMSSIFYSDSVISNHSVIGGNVNNRVKYSVLGEFVEGQVILPLAEEKYEPLTQVTSNLPKPISLYPGVESLLFDQRDIYEQVQIVKGEQAFHTNEFIDETTSLLQTYASYMFQISEDAENFLTEKETNVLNVVEEAHGQVANDLAMVSAAENELAAYIQASQSKPAQYISCIERGTNDLEQIMDSFELMADGYKDENDRIDPLEDRLDLISEAQEEIYDSMQQELHNCVGTEEQLEEMALFEFEVGIAEEGQYQTVAAFENESSAIDSEVELLGTVIYDQGLSFAELAKAIVNEERLSEFEHAFDQWISPAYLGATTFQPVANVQLNKSTDVNGNGTDKGSAISETLCEGSPNDFNIEFTVSGVGVVIGSPWSDSIKAGDENNLIITLHGDDCIESHGGVDFVFSGPDEDTIYGGDHHDFLVGGKHDDEIHGSAGKTYSWETGNVDIGNVILGAGGGDEIFGGEDDADKGGDGEVSVNGYTDIILGDLWYTGDAAKDTINGERGIDFILGEQGDDQLSNPYTGAITLYGIDFKIGSFFFGGSGADRITGSNSTGTELTQAIGDFIFGNSGRDTADGQGGNDFMFGGEGFDTFSGGDDIDFVFGNLGDDTVSGGDGIDLVSGDRGNDNVSGNKGDFDLLLGGRGNDTMSGGDGVDLLIGSQENDMISGNKGVDVVLAGRGNDTVWGGDDVDIIFGSQDDDNLHGQDGVDIIFGGDGADYVTGGASTDVILGNDNGDSGNRDNLNGQDGVDIIFGNSGNDLINGGDGTDILFGNSGDDQILGGAGVDFILGNSGNDNLSGEGGTDIVLGNAGNDEMFGGASTDVMLGNEGCDMINGGDATDIMFGNVGADKLMAGSGTDLVFGNSGNDMLYGESGTDILFGNTDNDYISSGDGTNVVFGNDGNDHIIGGANKDIVWGNKGNDYIAGGSDKDFIWGNRGNDTIDGGSHKDFLWGNRDNDLIKAGDGSDYIWGNRGNDRIRAVEGKNRAWGNRGDDTLDGNKPGNDSRDKLRGNRDNDRLTGDSSNSRDKLRGGWGSDTKMRNTTLLPDSLFNEPTYAVDECLQ